MGRRARGGIEHRVHRRAVAVDAHIGHAGRMRLVGMGIDDHRVGGLGFANRQRRLGRLRGKGPGRGGDKAKDDGNLKAGAARMG